MPAASTSVLSNDTYGRRAVASVSNLTFTDVAGRSAQHARCPHPAVIKGTRKIAKRRYPLWAFLFVFVLPPFTLHAALSGRAEIVERPLFLHEPAGAAPVVKHVLGAVPR